MLGCFVFVFVSICSIFYNFNELWCGLLSCMHLWVTDQSWRTGPNESALHFEVVFVVCWHQIRKLLWSFSKQFYNFFLNALHIVISSYIEDIETNLPIGKHILRVFTWYFEEIVGKNLLRFFIYMFVSICCVLGHFQGFMLLNETFRLAITNTFKGSGPKLADWSKWIHITLRSYLCSLLTSIWEVSTDCSLNSFINFAQIAEKLVMFSNIENIETSFPNRKHTFCVSAWYFEENIGKNLFWCFIYAFASDCCMLCHFQQFMLLKATLWLTGAHTFQGSRTKLADWSKWICITLQSWFYSLLTSNWEVSKGPSLQFH